MSRIYLILGGSSDLGCALLKRLNHEQKNSVFLMHYYSSDDNIKSIEAENGNVIKTLWADLSKKEEVQRLIDRIENEYVTPTHIVHFPASKFEYMKLKNFSDEVLQKDMEIQVYSLIQILKSFLPEMIKIEEKAKVVAMLSSYTFSVPPKYMMNYIISKYALLGLVKSLASDYAGKNVCINGISPSMIETKFLSEIDERIIAINADNSVGKKNAVPEQIIPAIVFLLSADSDYITGINLNVSNGNNM